MSIPIQPNVLNAFYQLDKFNNAVQGGAWVKIEKLEETQNIRFIPLTSTEKREKCFKKIHGTLIKSELNQGSSLKDIRNFIQSQLFTISASLEKLPTKLGDLPAELANYKHVIKNSIKLINELIEEHNTKIDNAFSGKSWFSKVRCVFYKFLYFTRDLDSVKKRFKVKRVFDDLSEDTGLNFYRAAHRLKRTLKKPAMLEAILMLPQGKHKETVVKASLDEMLTFFKEKMRELDSLSPEQAASLQGIGELLAQHGLLKSGGNMVAKPSVSGTDTPPEAPPTDDVPPAPPIDEAPPEAPLTEEAPASINSIPDWRLKLLEKQRNKPVVGPAGAVKQGGTAAKPRGDDDLMTALKKRLAERYQQMNGRSDDDVSSTSPTGSTTGKVSEQNDGEEWDE